MITVIAGGKPSKNWVADGVSEYEKRLKPPFNVKWQFFEEEKLLKYLEKWPFSAQDFVILTDERGKNISSPDLSKLLSDNFLNSRNVFIIIGGAYGVSPEIRARANFVWSFSNLVFPHELMRVMLSEQIYRAQEIAHGGKYHHS